MIYKNTAIRSLSLIVALATSFFSYGDEDPASIQHRYMTPSMRVSTNAWLSVSGNVERIVSAATNGLAKASDLDSYLPLTGGTVIGNLTLETSSMSGSPTLEVFGISSRGIKLNAEYGGKITVGSGSNGGGQIVLEDSSMTGDREADVTIGTVKVRATLAAKADKTNVYTKAETDAKVNAIGDKADEAYSAAEQMVDAVNSLAGTIGTHIRNTKNPHKVTAAQVGAYSRAEVDSKIESAVLPTDPTFSNAVLAVGLNIDTNSVAVLNEIAETFGGFPIEGTATTVGGLLAALAAAIAWLKKNKVQTLKLEDGSIVKTAENGVVKVDDFFGNSNSLLNTRITYERNATGLKDRAFNALTFDGTEYNISTALASVTPTASGQPRDLIIVATATAATTISFTAGTIKGDKPTIDGSGTWLITLTEYASGVWYCRQIKMEDAA